LNHEEQRYLRLHAESLLYKQQPWHEALLKATGAYSSAGRIGEV